MTECSHERERETTIQQEKETRGLTEGREGGRKAGLVGGAHRSRFQPVTVVTAWSWSSASGLRPSSLPPFLKDKKVQST